MAAAVAAAGPQPCLRGRLSPQWVQRARQGAEMIISAPVLGAGRVVKVTASEVLVVWDTLPSYGAMPYQIFGGGPRSIDILAPHVL